jgi:PAS domain S-box-containing protein
LTVLGDTLLSLGMVELASGFESPFATVFFVVCVSIAMRCGFYPALSMALLVIAVEASGQTSAPGALIRGVFLCLSVFFASFLRRQAQRESMQKTAILEQMTDAVLVTDAAGRIDLTNAAAQKLYGSPGRPRLGTSMEAPLVDVVGGRKLEVDLYEIAVRRALRGEPVEAENQVVDTDGVGRWITASATPLRGIQGGIRGPIVVAHDLTERKLALEALQASEGGSANSTEAVHCPRTAGCRLATTLSCKTSTTLPRPSVASTASSSGSGSA